MPGRRERAAIAFALALVARPGDARAGIGDVLGMGPEILGMAGAGSALSTGPWAAHASPAGLAFGTGGELSLGIVGIGSDLHAGGERLPIEDPVGFLGGYSLARPLPGRVVTAVAFGIAIHAMPGPIAHVLMRTPETPFFVAFDNRTQRDMLVPALALLLGGHVALGLSLDMFAGISGPVTMRDGQAGDVETSIFLDIVTTLRPTPGIMVRAGPGLSFALTYHPAFSVPHDFRLDAEVSGLDLEMRVKGSALYTPHAIVLGAAWIRPRLRLALDVAWSMWSLLGDPFVEVETRILEVGLIVPSNPVVHMKDTVAIRLGGEWSAVHAAAMDLVLRGGLSWESPIVGPQSGRSNVMDGHKIGIALGLGTRWAVGLPSVRALRLDLHAGVVLVTGIEHVKVVSTPEEGRDDPSLIVDEDEDTPGVQVTNPGYPSISGSGLVTSMSFTLTLELR